MAKLPKSGGIQIGTGGTVSGASDPGPEARKDAQGEQKGILLKMDVTDIDRVDKARAHAGRLSRRAWIRLAIAEKLNREGF